MGFSLKPVIVPRERILLFGVGGTGKSNAAMTIAEKVSSNLYVLDNDLSYDRLLWTEYQSLGETGRMAIEDIDVTEWQGYIDVIKEWTVDSAQGPNSFEHKGKRYSDDWLVIDSATPTWDAVQSWYVEQVFGTDTAAHMLKLRTSTKDHKEFNKALANDMQWQIINKEYAKLIALLLRWPGHLLLTAEQAAISEDEGKDVKAAFGPYGVKPKGNKRLGHLTSTVLWMTKQRSGQWFMTTVKDRGRGELIESPVDNFAADYLMAIGGWKLQRDEG